MRRGYLHFLLSLLLVGGALLNHACSTCSGLDEYEDYTFGGQADAGDGERPDGGSGDGGMSSADGGETWWERYDRLSRAVSERCGEVELYCNGGSESDLGLDCPERCHAVTSRHCFCPYARYFEDAKAVCATRDMHLVKIDDETENEIIGGLMAGLEAPEGHLGAAWIGLGDQDGDGTFTWMDGSEPSYKDWADDRPGEPSQDSEATCVVIEIIGDNEYAWHDRPCRPSTGWAKESRLDIGHYFFCEGEGGDAASDVGTPDFVATDSSPCDFPEDYFAPEFELCCTTIADVASAYAAETGRCGFKPAGEESLCAQFCLPGRSDWISGCEKAAFGFPGSTVGAPCCTVFGNENDGFLCGSATDTGCSVSPNTWMDTCSEPTAYKDPDKPLYPQHTCGETVCRLDYPWYLTLSEQCCTTARDKDLFFAVEEGQCGLRFYDWVSFGCYQAHQQGPPDADCPPRSLAEGTTFEGCCTAFGICGVFMEDGDLGCYTWMAQPVRLCVRQDKDPDVGADPLFNLVGVFTICEQQAGYNGNEYVFCKGPLDWKQARAACEWKENRHLVHVNDAGENEFLFQTASNAFDPAGAGFWIGAYESDFDYPDQWYWSAMDSLFFTGERYQCHDPLIGDPRVIGDSYVNWAGCDEFPDTPQPFDDAIDPAPDGGSPDGGVVDLGPSDGGVTGQDEGENCGSMGPRGYWWDEHCALEKAFVCEEEI